jgi:hypothetical protein
MSQSPGTDPNVPSTQVFAAVGPTPTEATARDAGTATQVFAPAMTAEDSRATPADRTQMLPATAPEPTQVVPAHTGDAWLPPASTQVISAASPEATQVRAQTRTPAPAPVRRTPVLPTASAPGGPYRPAAHAAGTAGTAPSPSSSPYRTPPAHQPYPATRRATQPYPAAASSPPAAPAASSPPSAPRPARPAPAAPRHPAPAPAVPQPYPAERRRPEGARRGTEPTAVAAMVAAVVGFVVPLVGIIAIVLGGIGADRARRRGTGGRGMARTATVLGSIQVVVTTLVVLGGLLLWNAVADDLRRGLDQLDGVAVPELSLPDLALDGLTGELSLDDVTDILGTVGQVGELGDLADRCQSGDVAACDDLVGQIPEDLLPSS